VSPGPAVDPSIAQALGGKRGLVDSGLPGVVFVAVFTVSHELTLAIWCAVASGAALAAMRLARRETLQHAVTGFMGVAIAAFIAQRTGRAANFFLPGLLINVGYAIGYAVSIVVGWPLLGLVLGPVLGEGIAWRRDPRRLRAYQKASILWVGMFCLRVAVQWPLYAAGLLVPLGIARLAMGWPLFAVTIWLSWLVLRTVPAAVPSPDTDADPVADPEADRDADPVADPEADPEESDEPVSPDRPR
jgi:uncharacterized protein DUF3159